MYIDKNTIIMAASVISALVVIFSAIFAVYRWYLRQNRQDIDIKKIKDEQCLLTYGILACLDGLQQLGANHSVPEVRNRIEKHINKQAHEQED